MRAIALAAVLACGCLSPAIAAAAEGGSAAEADTLFTQGRELLEQGRYAEACEKLRKSDELAPAIGTLLNLGYCYEQLQRYASAMDAYAEAALLAKDARDDKRERFARERFAAVEPKALKLVLRVAEGAASGIEVKRNGMVMPPATWGIPVPVDPEDIVISAAAPGRTPWRAAVLGRGEGATMTVIVPPLDHERPIAAPPPKQEGLRLGAKRIVAVGLGGAALAAFGAGVGLGLGARSRYDDSLAGCDATGCSDAARDAQRGAVAQGNVATVLVAAGLACVGGGVYLWLTGGDGAKTGASARAARAGAIVW